MPDIQASLDVDDFVKFIQHYKTAYAAEGMEVTSMVLSADVADLITNAFFHGSQTLNEHLKHRTNRYGKIVMTLCGVRIYPTAKVDMFHPLFILSNPPVQAPNGPNPVFPAPGPGTPPSGGTPVSTAIAKAA